MPLIPTGGAPVGPMGGMGPQLPPALMGGMGPEPMPDPLQMALAAREQLDALIALLMGPQVAAEQPPPAVGGEAIGF